MRKFLILFGARRAPRLAMEVMAPDAMAAADQHLCLKLPCERMEVVRA